MKIIYSLVDGLLIELTINNNFASRGYQLRRLIALIKKPNVDLEYQLDEREIKPTE